MIFGFICGLVFAYVIGTYRERYFPSSFRARYMINQAQRKRQKQIAERAVEYIRMGFAPYNAGGMAREELERVAKADMREMMEAGLTNGSLDDMNKGWQLIPG